MIINWVHDNKSLAISYVRRFSLYNKEKQSQVSGLGLKPSLYTNTLERLLPPGAGGTPINFSDRCVPPRVLNPDPI